MARGACDAHGSANGAGRMDVPERRCAGAALKERAVCSFSLGEKVGMRDARCARATRRVLTATLQVRAFRASPGSIVMCDFASVAGDDFHAGRQLLQHASLPHESRLQMGIDASEPGECSDAAAGMPKAAQRLTGTSQALRPETRDRGRRAAVHTMTRLQPDPGPPPP
jgi:hypothetical protein